MASKLAYTVSPLWIMILLLLCSPALAADEWIPMEADNCNIIQPPKEAGDSQLNDRLMKIFPRREQMGERYTGCQTLWLDIQGRHKLEKIMVLYFENGETKVQQHIAAGRSFSCRYYAGSLLPNSRAECSKRSIGTLSSLPAGCTRASLRDEKQHASNCGNPD